MTEIKNPIPSRIYNAAVGGHVAGANDIIDDELEMTQAEINKNEYIKPASTGPTGDYPNNGMGRIVLKKNKTFAEQLTQTNTIYEIRYDFDLNDPDGEHPITIPEGCMLEFNGGSLRNGIIVCQNTILKGNIVIDKISGSIIGEFKSSYSTYTCGYYKLNMILSLNVNKLIIDENYTITDYNEAITSSIKSVAGTGITINVNCDIVSNGKLSTLLRFNNYPTEISGFNFDFHSHALKYAILVENTSSIFNLKNVTICNVDNRLNGVSTSDGYNCNCIIVTPSNNSVVYISDVNISDIKIWGVGEIGDANGSQYGIYCSCGTNIVDVNISDCSFKNIEDYSIDDSITRIIHDSAGIYLHKDPNVFETSFNIKGIRGIAFGKRLIKTDGGNVKISNVCGFQGDVSVYPLSLISLNSGDVDTFNNNASFVEDITYIGDSEYVVGLFAGCTLNNVYIHSEATKHAVIASGAKGIVVNNVYIYGYRSLIYSTDNNLSCTFNNVTYLCNKDESEKPKTTSFYFVYGYGFKLDVNNLNLFGGGYGYISFVPYNNFEGQREINITNLYYEACRYSSTETLDMIITVGRSDIPVNLKINKALIKVSGNACRGLFTCPSQSSLSIENSYIYFENTAIKPASIPYGSFLVGDSNKLYLNNVKISNSNWGYNRSLYLYDDRTDKTVFNDSSVFIHNCNVNEVKPATNSITGIEFGQTLTNVIWSGGDLISVNRLPTGLTTLNAGFKTKLATNNGYSVDKTITWDGYKWIYDVNNIGTEAQRPSGSSIHVGFQYMQVDDTNGTFPLWASAINGDTVTWVKAVSFTAAQWAAIQSGITAAIVNNLHDSDKLIRSTSVRTIVTLTQAQYDALATKDANTEYNIIESV